DACPVGGRASGRYLPRHLLGLGDLQSFVRLSPGAHDPGGIPDHLFRDRRCVGLVPAQGRAPGAGDPDAAPVDRVRADRAAAADPGRRPAWPQHRRTPAAEGRGDGGPLGKTAGRRGHAARAVGDPGPGRRDKPPADRGAATRRGDPDPHLGRTDRRAGLGAGGGTAAGGAGVLRVPVMVGLGIAMLLLAVASGVRWRQGRLATARHLHRAWNLMLPAGFVAIIAGWFVTEMGRQPWVVYGQLRTADAVSNVGGSSVALSLGIYILAYAVVFGFGTAYILNMLRR